MEVWPISVYGCDIWTTLKATDEKRISAFEMKQPWKISRSRTVKRQRTGSTPIPQISTKAALITQNAYDMPHLATVKISFKNSWTVNVIRINIKIEWFVASETTHPAEVRKNCRQLL